MKTYLSEFIYGSVDGLITTFSIVAGSIGGNLSQRVIMVLGISNVLSDGYSMGVSRYLSAVAEKEQGISFHDKPAWVAGVMTFLSFVAVGVFPILPFAFLKNRSTANHISLFTAMIMFFVVGIVKGYVVETMTDKPASDDKSKEANIQYIVWSGTQTLGIGMSAALISYLVGSMF